MKLLWSPGVGATAGLTLSSIVAGAEGGGSYSHMQLVKPLPPWSGLHPGDLDTPSGLYPFLHLTLP